MSTNKGFFLNQLLQQQSVTSRFGCSSPFFDSKEYFLLFFFVSNVFMFAGKSTVLLTNYN